MALRPQMPGLFMQTWSQYPGSAWALFKAGEAMDAGDVVVFDPAAALNVGGSLPTVKLTTSGNDKNVLGAVADWIGSIAADAMVLIQVAGLHPGVQCDGTTDLANGDLLGTFTVKGSAQKATDSDSRAFATYVDAAYTTDSAAKKKVWLRNPMGIVHPQIT